jgi:chromosome segregation ATPase
VSDADDIAALRITIEEMLDAATIERLGVDDSRDIHTCVLRICSELRSVEAERDRLRRSLDNFINSNANLSEQLSAQTARADALEALNATMHERISGLVAEIAQLKTERDEAVRILASIVDEMKRIAADHRIHLPRVSTTSVLPVSLQALPAS